MYNDDEDFEYKEDIQIVGVHAVEACFKRRSDDIGRVYIREDMKVRFGALLEFMADEKRAYEVVEDEDLEKLTNSRHHEGICALAHPKWEYFVPDFLEKEPHEICCILALDGVSNPHNLGAIMRVAAHFGVFGIMVEDDAPLQSSAAFRTSEGGAEYLTIIRSRNFRRDIKALQAADFEILATSSHTGIRASAVRIPPRCVILLGSESDGVQEVLLNTCDMKINIQGTGRVESLNVATAASAILTEFYRQHLA